MKCMLAALMIFVGIALLGGCGYKEYTVSRDITAVKDRAQVAADREDMIFYLEQLKANLEERGWTEGHAALLFKTPKNDLALNYQSINKILERLHSLESVERNSTTYQVALDDIRGTLREIWLPAGELSWAKFGWWMTLLGLGLLVGAGVFIWYNSDY